MDQAGVPKLKTMSDLAKTIQDGDTLVVHTLKELTQCINQVCDSIAQTQNRITSIETLLEAQQLSNVSMLDKLAKVGSALISFVANFGTKKDEATTKDEVEADEVKKE